MKDDSNLSDGEVTRIAMRIAMSSWAQLQVDSETSNDADILRKYIQLCPYVSPDSAAVDAALEGLNRWNSNSNAQRAPPNLVNALPVEFPDDLSEERSHGTDTQLSHPPINGTRSMPSVGIPAPTQTVTNKKHGLPRWFHVGGHLLRTLVLDFPLVAILLTYLSICWIHRMHDLYLKPQMDVMEWTSARSSKEITYYHRTCDHTDMSTLNPKDLFLPPDATPDEACDHHIRHGFTLFPGVLSDEVATNLRNHVVARNPHITPDESIFVINGAHRYSFGLSTEEPVVARAIEQVATNSMLVTTLEKILGPNPALVEMTAITSSYGATPQYFHDDVVPSGSAVQFAHSFSPYYSIFIPLQNTTGAMGATSTCPGSHLCPYGGDDFCEQYGFQPLNEQGFWRAGDAMLMNLNSYHRGDGHTDKDGLDRVLFILTFIPRPRARAESRQIAQGLSYSLRWDMWGHTLRDMVQASSVMVQPWPTLRALGLYKRRDADWGLDYITSSSMRMVNDEYGFRRHELDDFIERGGLKFIPKFLHGTVNNDSESWYEYVFRTFLNCERFLQKVFWGYLAGYILVVSIISWFFNNALKCDGFPSGGRRVVTLARRVLSIYLLCWATFKALNYHVDHSDWAKDIVAGRRFSNVFANEGSSQEKVLRFYGSPFLSNERLLNHLPGTFPNRRDVLIANRYASKHLGLFNNFINVHPGNDLFRSYVRELAKTFKNYSELFREATASYIVSIVQSEHGRFLYQDWEPSWVWLSPRDAMEYTKWELMKESNSIVKKMATEVDFLISEQRYGFRRDTALAHNHSVRYLKNLLQLLVQQKIVKDSVVLRPASPVSKKSTFVRCFTMPKLTPTTVRVTRKVELQVGEAPQPPNPKAWLKEGDLVDARYQERNGEHRQYQASIGFIKPSGSFLIRFVDGESAEVDDSLIRPFEPYYVGEELEVLFENKYVPATVVAASDSGYYDVALSDTDMILAQVTAKEMRRYDVDS